MKQSMPILLVLASLPACTADKYESRAIVETRTWMRDILIGVESIYEISGDMPPATDDDEFWKWCATHSSNAFVGNPLVSPGRIGHDAWGQRIKVLASSRQIEGLASLGPNMKWDNMERDDIVVKRTIVEFSHFKWSQIVHR